MTRHIDIKYIKHILDNAEKYALETVINAKEGYAVLEWQTTVYGNRTTADIMDAYNEYKESINY